MNCPLCNSKEHVEIDLHADGFTQDAYECGDCGAVWVHSSEELKILKERNDPIKKVYSSFTCPTCKAISCIETDLDAFQFHEELQECSNCGTICSSAHDQVEVVKDSQPGSFLSTTSDLVESDDYVFM